MNIKCLRHKKTLEPFGFSQSICTRTLQNLTRYLHRNPPEPHKVPTEPHHISSPSPSGTSSRNCTGNFRNLTRYLHQNPLEPNFRNLTRYQHQNLQNLVRNLVLQLHTIAPELIWAKDHIAKFCCLGKI